MDALLDLKAQLAESERAREALVNGIGCALRNLLSGHNWSARDCRAVLERLIVTSSRGWPHRNRVGVQTNDIIGAIRKETGCTDPRRLESAANLMFRLFNAESDALAADQTTVRESASANCPAHGLGECPAGCEGRLGKPPLAAQARARRVPTRDELMCLIYGAVPDTHYSRSDAYELADAVLRLFAEADGSEPPVTDNEPPSPLPDCPHGVGLCTSSCPREMALRGRAQQRAAATPERATGGR